jgi:P27 family predicted phage terminase small subunit
MGKRGPPPKSAEVLRLTGNPGHRRKERLEGGTFNPPLELPPPPKFLSKVARDEYMRLGRILFERGTIAAVDRGALTMLATSWATHVEAEEAMSAMTRDELVDPVTGRLHPLLAISRKAAQNVLMLSKAFGLTPASRNSVSHSAPQSPGGASKWSQFD